MHVVIYGDFNCLYCYLASQRADRLARAGTAEIEWRAVEHDRRLPVTGVSSNAVHSGEDRELAQATDLALPGEQLPAAAPAMVSNTRAAVAAYTEAVRDGVQDELRGRLFAAIWARGRNLSSPFEVRRVVTDLMWPAAPVYSYLLSPDLPVPLVHDPDLMRIVRRSGGTVTPDGGPLSDPGYWRCQQWRQQWLLLPQQAVPAVISAGRIHSGPDALRCLAGIRSAAGTG
jgi:hypothetical protein